ncbi:transient receptor potential cation channel subfamily M member-like 2 [Watersipora subatra]|uniref:transient receptor potential cation channel subfamily M member-like 2 n=1 Tax=Watersipora subatra TaxID=2589382 RepID=UPI00355BCD4B
MSIGSALRKVQNDGIRRLIAAASRSLTARTEIYNYKERRLGNLLGYRKVRNEQMDGKMIAASDDTTRKVIVETKAGRLLENRSDYIRLNDDDEQYDLFKLLLDHWQLPEPKLVVSIVGGAKRFQFDKSRASTMFKQGLLDLTTTTGAWILTPGSNNGVYEMVGSAVKDHLDATGSSSMNNIVLLGIAAWGSVAERQRLESSTGEGSFPAVYPITEVVGNQRSQENANSANVKRTEPLDPNHSHFILVDNGSRNTFGGESKWGQNFEKSLTSHVLASSGSSSSEGDAVHIPMVTLLVNGGDGSLEGCSESLPAQIPLLAVAGSGRAAEIVVQLKALCQGQTNATLIANGKLTEIYQRVMGKDPSDAVINSLRIIASYHKYISVFDLNQLGIDSDEIGLDRAIISALYHKDNLDISKMKAQMKLAISWNRADYARDEIFDVHGRLYRQFMKEKTFLHKIVTEALLQNLPDFVELLLEHGLNLTTFVTRECLQSLYEKSMEKKDGYSRFVSSLFPPSVSDSPGCCIGMRSSQKPEDYMDRVGEMLKFILGHTYPNIYKVDGSNNSLSSKNVDGKQVYTDPAQHLFLWATLFNRMDLAKLFWRLSEDQIAGAIVGAAIMQGMARESNHEESIDITASYLANSRKFEKLANGILDCCWSTDRQYTSEMLVREAPNWGRTTVLSMAYHGEMEEFLAQPACYTKLSKIWRGDIALRTHLGLIVLFAFLPLMAFLLKFVRKKDDEQRMDERQQEILTIEDTHKSPQFDQFSPDHKNLIPVTLLGRQENEISYPRAIYRGLCSPIVKCIHYAVRRLFTNI